MSTADSTTLNRWLEELHAAQLPSEAPSTAPAWLPSPDDAADLALWGLTDEDADEDLVILAVTLAGWFRDRPDVRDALVDALFDPDDRIADAAAISLLGADDRAGARLFTRDGEPVRCDTRAGWDLAHTLVAEARHRADPGARRALEEAIDLDGGDSAATEAAALLGRVAPLSELAALATSGWSRQTEAITPALALRAEPEAAAATVAAIDDDDGCVAEKALNGLWERFDPGAIEPLLRTWEDHRRAHDRNEELYGAEDGGFIDLVDALGATPEGRGQLKRLADDPEPAVAVLAQTFLVRSRPTPEGLAALRRLVPEPWDEYDPEHGRFEPAVRILAEDAPTGWPDRVAHGPADWSAPWRPPWADLPARPSDLAPLVALQETPSRGWRWLDTPEIRDTVAEPWSELPVVAEVAGHAVRWAGPLVDQGHAELFDGMTDGLTDHYGDVGALLRPWPFPEAPFAAEGEVTLEWAQALVRAARGLARMGGTSDVEIWLAWLGVQVRGVGEALRNHAG